MKKRLLAMLLCVAMVASLLTVGAAADSGDRNGEISSNARWSYDASESTLTISGSGKVKNLPVEEITNGQYWNFDIDCLIFEEGITSIGDLSITAWGTTSIGTSLRFKELELPASLNEIEGNPFSGQVDLNSIVVADGNTKFFVADDNVLYEWLPNDEYRLVSAPSVSEHDILDGTIEIGDAFSGNAKIKSLVIPDGVDEANLFHCRSLTSLTLPSDMTSFYTDSIFGCVSLARIDIPASCKTITSGYNMDGTELRENTSIYFHGDAPKFVYSLDTMEESNIMGWNASHLTVYYPENASGWNEVINNDFHRIEIELGALEFHSWNPSAPVQPEYATSGDFGENATWSYDAETKTITISGTGEARVLSWQNFPGDIEHVVIESGITSIGAFAFDNSAFSNVVSYEIPSTVKSIKNSALYSNVLTELNLPSGLREIGEYSICIPTLEHITIPSTVEKIGERPFAPETTISIESGNAKFFIDKDSVLYERLTYNTYRLICSTANDEIANYSILPGTTEIYVQAFYMNTALKSVVIPSGVTELKSFTFYGCQNLTSVTLPSTLQRADFQTSFWFCHSLRRLDVPASCTIFYTGGMGPEDSYTAGNLDIYFYGSTAPTFEFSFGIVIDRTPDDIKDALGNIDYYKGSITIHYPSNATGWDSSYSAISRYVESGALIFKTWDPSQNPPQIIELSPANGATISETATTYFRVTYDTPIAATSTTSAWSFPELDFSKGTIEIRRTSDEALIYSVEANPYINELYNIEGTYSGDVKVENSNTLLIQPFNVHTLFDADEEYYVTIPAGFFTFENGATNEAVEKGEWTISTFENEPSTDEDGEGFTLGRDTLNGYNIFDDGILSDEHRALLKSKIPLWEKLLLKQAYQLNASQESLGLCFGMTAIMALIYDGRLKASDLQEGAKTAFDLDLSNPTVKSWVAYYNLTQFFEPVKSSDTWMEGMHPRGREQQLIKVLKDNQIAIVGLDFKAPGFVNAGHAVLAYDLDEESDPENYIVYFADPSSLAKAGHACPPGVLLINKVSYEANAYYSYHLVNETLYEDHDFIGLNSVIYDFSVFDKFISKSVSSGAGGAVKAATLNQNSYIEVNTSSSNFRIDIGNQYAVISGCKKVSGELDVVGPLVTLAGGNDSSTHAYRIYNASVEEVKISYSDEECHSTGIAFSSSEYTSTVSSYATEIVVKSTGDISVKNGRGTSEIATVAGSNFAPNLAIQAKLNISNFALKVNSSEVQITSGESLGNITVSGLSDWDAVTIDCTTDGRTVSITESTTPNMGKLLTVTDESSAVIGRAGITNTVVFISNGGSFVDAQSGISYGGKAVCPVNPTKAGYVFGGWYKDEALTEPWNFNVDVVTEYTWLYAKWLDESTLPEEPSNPNWPSIDIPSHQPIEPDEPAETLPFTDVSVSDWFNDYVTYVYANGLMDGVSATEFNPNGTMTRAMLWTILARIDGQTVTGESWIETARAWAMSEGVSDGENANGLVTREQFATMLWRYAGEPASDYSLAAYTDASGVSDWAQAAMCWAVENGIITGVSATTIDPQGTATRAQAAAMLMRFIENIG